MDTTTILPETPFTEPHFRIIKSIEIHFSDLKKNYDSMIQRKD